MVQSREFQFPERGVMIAKMEPQTGFDASNSSVYTGFGQSRDTVLKPEEAFEPYWNSGLITELTTESTAVRY